LSLRQAIIAITLAAATALSANGSALADDLLSKETTDSVVSWSLLWFSRGGRSRLRPDTFLGRISRGLPVVRVQVARNSHRGECI